MAKESSLRTELFKALTISASIASAQAVLATFDSLYYLTVIYVDESQERKLRADELLRHLRERRNDLVASFWPEALAFLKDIQEFSLSDLPRAIDAITQNLHDPQSVPGDWESHLRNLGKDIDAITEEAKALHEALVGLEIKVRASKNELYRLLNVEESDPVDSVEKEQIKIVAGVVLGASVAAAVATVNQWVSGTNDQPHNCFPSLRFAIDCFDSTNKLVQEGLNYVDNMFNPPIPHRGILAHDAEAHLAEMLSQLRGLVERSVATKWEAVKVAFERLGIQLRDSDGYRESALAELQEVKHLCNAENAPDTS